MITVKLGKRIKRRLPYIENKVDGILNYDKDNAYPQRMRELLNTSGAGKGSVKLFGWFLRGMGFADQAFNELKINAHGQTVRDLLREAVDDYKVHKGCAIHVDYNAFLQPVNPTVVPFEQCRMGVPDDAGHNTKIVTCYDWTLEKNKLSKAFKQRVDIFNPDPVVVQAQIARAGGLQNYKGQILYVTENVNQYPLCSFDEVAADVAADGGVSVFRENSVGTNFMAGAIVEVPFEFATDSERREFNGNLETFQGPEGTGKLLVIENPDAGTKPLKIIEVKIQNNDNLFRWTEESAQSKIRKAFTQPAILVGDLTPGKLGNTQELINSFSFYNIITFDDRDKLSRAFKSIFSIMPGITVTTWDITPLTWSAFIASGATGEPVAEEGAPTPGNKLGIAEFNKCLKQVAKFKNGTITEAELTVFLKGYGMSDADIATLIADVEDGELDGNITT